MTELISTIAIIVSSVLLFGYWFRYTCLLILSAHTTRDYAGSVAAANQLSFLEVQGQIRAKSNANLDQLRASLDRDYDVVTYLLKHAAHRAEGQASLERHMLAINYRVMRAWYGVSRSFSESAACRALDEMSQVVAHFANAMGERAASAA